MGWPVGRIAGPERRRVRLTVPPSRVNSTLQLSPERLQLALALRARLGILHVEPLERVEQDLRDDQPGVFLVVGGNDVPRSRVGARRGQAFLVGLGVVFPEFALFQIRVAELPVLAGVVDAVEKALSLFFFREVEKELDDASPVDVEMPLEIVDGTVTLAPDFLVVMRRLRNGFGLENVAMHPNDQDLLIVGTIEDRDPSALRQISGRPPEKVVFQLRFRGLLEAVDPTALRIDAGHHMTDRAILTRRVGSLKDEQYRVTIGGVMEMLHLAEPGDMLFQQALVLLFGFVDGVDLRRPLFEIDLVALAHSKVL